MIVVLVAFTAINLIQSSSLQGKLVDKLAEMKELSRPAELELTIINSNCNDCFDISSIVDQVKSGNVNITNELSLSAVEAQDLITKYNIEKLPSLIVKGELEKVQLSNFDESEDVLLFSQQLPPFVNVKTGSVVGRVTAITIREESCEKCSDVSQILAAMKQSHINIISERVIDSDSKEARSLITKYGISKLPTLVLSSDIRAYNNEVTQALPEIGVFANDGSFVTREANPPYYDLATNSVRGLVDLTILKSSSCTNCYDAESFHGPIIARLGIALSDVKKVDVNSAEGKELVSKYNVVEIPTILLNGDTDSYSHLPQIWANVGTIEPDKTFVFRKVKEITRQTYFDLKQNKVIEGGQQ